MKSRRSFKLQIEWRAHVSNHGLNGISLYFVGFELFKKVLLVALGICLSICHLVILILIVYDYIYASYI